LTKQTQVVNENTVENGQVDPAESIMMHACKTGKFAMFIVLNMPLFSTKRRPSTVRKQTNNNQQGNGTVGPIKDCFVPVKRA
jgi:hypothetical protein